MHVLTSKGIYETGEDLWFKCIVLDDSTRRVSDRSHTAYVEILDPTDSVVWQEKYRVMGGMCDGHVQVGDRWTSGEYRMHVHTRGSLGLMDTVLYPKRFLVLNELTEAPEFLDAAKDRMEYVEAGDNDVRRGPIVTVSLDSTTYGPHSKVKATVRVTDSLGNPMSAVVALSVSDALYRYEPSEVDIDSQLHGMTADSLRRGGSGLFFLSDGAASGYLRPAGRRGEVSIGNRYINIFDESAKKGDVNIIKTRDDGYFEVSPEIGSSLGRELLIKPLTGDDDKLRLEIDNPFTDIEEIRKRSVERYYPLIRRNEYVEVEDTVDYVDYKDRRSVMLDDVIVKGSRWRRPKRSKVVNYLDSIAIGWGQAWVCCGKIENGKYVGGFLNDYVPGYTHHPSDDPYDYLRPPVNISQPERGKMYKMIKMKWNEKRGCYYYELESWAVFNGPYYTEDRLLELHGIWKGVGYYPKHRFEIPSVDEMMSGIDDIRNTLLWLPRAQTNENGEFTIEFPTSDILSTYKLTCLVIPQTTKSVHQVDTYMHVR